MNYKVIDEEVAARPSQQRFVLIPGLVAAALIAILFGISDSMVSNWDHTMHMDTIQRSTPLEVDGWRGYGTGYYRLVAAAKYALEPIHSALRLFGVETLGLQASAVFVNLAMVILFLLFGKKYLGIKNLSFIAIVVAFSISPIFRWAFRVYPDVALAGLLGICLVLVLAHSIGRVGLYALALAGFLYGLALHIKQPAILFAPGFGLLLLLSYKKPVGIGLFAVTALISYGAIGYPKEYQLVDWLMSYVSGQNDWMALYKGEVTLAWAKMFSRDTLLMAVIPSLPFLIARSDFLSIRNLGTRQYYLTLAALGVAFVAVYLAFFLQPVTVGTEHYTIIAIPIVAMFFLMLPVPVRVEKYARSLLIIALLVILYGQEWRHPKSVLSTKAAEINCQSSWREGESLIRAEDLRSPHIPFGVKAGSFFMAPGTLYDRVAGKETVNFIVNSRSWLSRLGRPDTRERAYQIASFHLVRSNWRSPSSQESLDQSFEILETMASIGTAESRSVGRFRIHVLFEDPACAVRVFQIVEVKEENFVK